MKRRTGFYWATLALFLFCSTSLFANNSTEATLMTVNGAINPATMDYIQRGIEKAIATKANLVILQLNTPGGLDRAMRGINQSILSSSIPVVTYVSPTGGRVASAGTYILYASQIASMAPGTHLGATTHVQLGPEAPAAAYLKEKNQITEKNLSPLEKKSVNEASAYIKSLAELRGRNAEWAEKAVRNSESLTADEALKLKVINLIAKDIPELLHKMNGLTVKVLGEKQVLHTDKLTVNEIHHDWRYELLAAITDPNIAYILLLIGLYGLFFEFYHPGFVLPGAIGAVSLLLALYAFQLLPINYVGFALLLLGITFMLIEIMVSSFGILGIGGIIAFVTGSILLLDMNSPGYHIAWSLITVMTFFSAAYFCLVVGLAVRARRQKTELSSAFEKQQRDLP